MDKFDKFLNEIKETKSSENLSNDFKNNLIDMMENEYSKDTKNNFKDFPNKFKKKSLSFYQKFAIVFSFFIIISGVTFGKNIIDLAKAVFSNQDKSIDLAIENGYYQNIDMDYIVHDDIGIKLDYVYNDDYCIYLAFNIKTNEEYNDLFIDEIKLRNENNEIIYDIDSDESIKESELKKVTKYNNIVLAKFYKDSEFKTINNLKINILKIYYESNGSEKCIENNWNFDVDIDNKLDSNEIEYAINSDNIISDYNIKLKKFRLKVDLVFENLELRNTDLKRENIYIEDEYGNKYYSNDIYYLKDKELKVNFPIETNNEIKKIKLIINNKDNKIILYLNIKNG